MLTSDLERFLTKFDILDNGCWQWNCGLGRGYGQFFFKGKNRRPHRVLWEAVVEPIEEGMQLDHLCRNRACVNPDHLEPVTCKENLLRGVGFNAVNAAKTHCPKNHELLGYNLVTRCGKVRGRECRICANDKLQARRRMKNG